MVVGSLEVENITLVHQRWHYNPRGGHWMVWTRDGFSSFSLLVGIKIVAWIRLVLPVKEWTSNISKYFWLIGMEKSLGEAAAHWGEKKIQVRKIKGTVKYLLCYVFSNLILPSDCSISTGHMQQNFASSDIFEHWNGLCMRHSLKSQTIDSQNLIT